MAVVQVSVRVSAISLAVSGAVTATLVPLHPSIFDRPVDEVVRDTEVWQPIHVASIFVFALAFIGAAGLVAVHNGQLRRLGHVGLVFSFAGAIGGSAIGFFEALVFPVLADRDPQLLELNGPMFTSWLAIGAGLLVLGWVLGLAVIGVAAARAAVFPRAAGVLLAVSGPAYLALGGPFIPVAGVLSGALFGAVQLWWGWLIWKSPAQPAEAHRLTVERR
ncbi:hypothetical protein NG697_18330 [Pseudarthrobacter sp. MDT3-26]|uniref:hypothetical protein n=1 Tax=Pseudarthrobacter raffinosi TaxID=2953651 RepID=UPI00208F1979|nr:MULTISPECIES: hypothetical protein [unclassified Pseudarthrobacter]MCO4238895.1 hypothetical protein [Pseudarthrobacter sp. MDT3-28]MCO4264851.1 hypothetical protein [Pseudarthrobacter sp. MDT3-26]